MRWEFYYLFYFLTPKTNKLKSIKILYLKNQTETLPLKKKLNFKQCQPYSTIKVSSLLVLLRILKFQLT